MNKEQRTGETGGRTKGQRNEEIRGKKEEQKINMRSREKGKGDQQKRREKEGPIGEAIPVTGRGSS
jgi:hypothetical protein